MPHIIGNIGFVFTKEDLIDIRDILTSNQKEAPAKAGALAPIDVFVEKVNTGLGPEKTSFFQALSIPTKITKGTIEILVRLYWCDAYFRKFSGWSQASHELDPISARDFHTELVIGWMAWLVAFLLFNWLINLIVGSASSDE